MKAIESAILAFDEADDTEAQRDAAARILRSLQSFFGESDFTRIEGKITDERLTESPLDERTAEDVLASLDEIESIASMAMRDLDGPSPRY